MAPAERGPKPKQPADVCLALTHEQTEFAAMMTCFVAQAKLQHQEPEFLGHVYAHYFCKWLSPQTATIIGARLNTERYVIAVLIGYEPILTGLFKCLHLDMLGLHQSCHHIEPPCDWEVFFSLPKHEYLIVSRHLLKRGCELREELRYRIPVSESDVPIIFI